MTKLLGAGTAAERRAESQMQFANDVGMVDSHSSTTKSEISASPQSTKNKRFFS